jgi:hypothetical protein
MSVQVAIDRYYYPDVTVNCDENEAENAFLQGEAELKPAQRDL